MKRREIREGGTWPARQASATWGVPDEDLEERRPATLVDLRCTGCRQRRLVGAIHGIAGAIDLVRIGPAPGGEARNVTVFCDVDNPNVDRWPFYCDRCGDLEPVTRQQFVAWAGEAKAERRRITKMIRPIRPRNVAAR